MTGPLRAVTCGRVLHREPGRAAAGRGSVPVALRPAAAGRDSPEGRPSCDPGAAAVRGEAAGSGSRRQGRDRGESKRRGTCIGVCRDKKVFLVGKDDHDAALAEILRFHAQLDVAASRLLRFERAVPRDGEWEHSIRALQTRCARCGPCWRASWKRQAAPEPRRSCPPKWKSLCSRNARRIRVPARLHSCTTNGVSTP